MIVTVFQTLKDAIYFSILNLPVAMNLVSIHPSRYPLIFSMYVVHLEEMNCFIFLNQDAIE